MAKTVTLRVEDHAYKMLLACAKADRRSLSNYIELAAMTYSREAVFADELEMREILADTNLVKKLKQGSKQARARKGDFVD